MHSDQFLLKENKLLRYFVWLVDNINKFTADLLKPIAVLKKKMGGGGHFFWRIPNLFSTVEMHDPLPDFVEQTVIFSSVHNSLLHFVLQYTYFHPVYYIFFYIFSSTWSGYSILKSTPIPNPHQKKLIVP